MRVTSQTRPDKKRGKVDLPLGFDWKIASRPGGVELIALVDRLNSGLKWPTCTKQEAARRAKMTKRVQKEVVQEVKAVLEAIQDPTGTQHPLVKLVDKINDLGLRGNWSVAQSVPMRIDEDTLIPIDAKALKIGVRHWLIQPWFHWERDSLTKWSHRLVRQMFYRPLISALETGEFKRLGMCKRRECQKFFVAEDLRREFCGDDCRIAFNNEQRLESGWFTEQRQKKWQRDIQRAKRLLDQGFTLEKVSEKISLSIRVLKRAGLRDN